MAAPAFIARYEVKQCLGRGGMGAIYLARDPLIDRLVAIKLLHADIASDEFRARFAQEAHASGGLTHPHIVTVHDYGEADGAPFIVMEYVRGETLAALIRRAAPIPVVQKLTWIEQVCQALGYAHSERVIHRDIKPSNLMLDQHDTIKVVDFGIARLVGGATTKMSAVIGTPGYMSPEQIQGGTIDARSDIFALGTVLYELLSYHEAFSGETPHAVMHRVIAGQPQPLDELVQGPDLSIVPVVEMAMQKDPGRRFPTMTAFANAVREARQALETAGHDLTMHRPGQAERSRSRRRTDPADLARRRADQIQQHIDRARRAKGAGDYDAAVAACEDALLIDPGSADALDLLDAIRHEAPSIGPPQPARRPVAVVPPSPPPPPPATPSRTAKPSWTVVDSDRTPPGPTSRHTDDAYADLTDVGEQPLRPWDTDAWDTAHAPVHTAAPASLAPPTPRRGIGRSVSVGVVVVAIAAALGGAAAKGVISLPGFGRPSAEPAATTPAEAEVKTPGPPAAVREGPPPAPPPVAEPPIVPAAAEQQPSPAAEGPEGQATASDPVPAVPLPAGQARPPTPKPVDPAVLARTIQRAEAARASGDLALALTQYREVLRLQPDNASAAQAVFRIRMEYLLRRARSLIEAEDFDAAERDLNSVAAEDPANPDADAVRRALAAARSGPLRKPKG